MNPRPARCSRGNCRSVRPIRVGADGRQEIGAGAVRLGAEVWRDARRVVELVNQVDDRSPGARFDPTTRTHSPERLLREAHEQASLLYADASSSASIPCSLMLFVLAVSLAGLGRYRMPIARWTTQRGNQSDATMSLDCRTSSDSHTGPRAGGPRERGVRHRASRSFAFGAIHEGRGARLARSGPCDPGTFAEARSLASRLQATTRSRRGFSFLR